ncbi:MAG: WD40 repeat domain-containing protein, partial [Flavitalea sp.]
MFIHRLNFVTVLLGVSFVVNGQEARLILPVGHLRAINHVAVSPDESIVATASSDRSVKIWEKATGKLIYNLDNFPSWVWFATFSPDGKKLLTSSGDSVLRIWNTENFQLAYELPKFRRDITTAEFSPDGKFFMATNETEELYFFDVNSGKKIKEISSPGNRFEKAIFSPDSKNVIATFRGKPGIMIYEWPSGKLLNTLKGHTDDIRHIRPGSNGKFLTSSSLDSTVNLWDIQTGALIHSYKSNSVIHGVAISPDSKQVCFVTLDGIIYLMDTGNGSVRQYSAPLKRITMAGIVYSPDSKQVYISSNSSNEIYKLDTETGKTGTFFPGHTEPVNNITLTRKGNALLSSSSDKTATLWDTQTGKMLVKFQGRNDEKLNPGFSNNGRYFLVHSTTAKFLGLHALDVWNTGSGKKIFSLHGGWSGFSKPVFSRDEQFMSVITLKDTVLNVFSLSSGKLLNTFKYTLDIEDDFFNESGDGIVLRYQSGKFMTWNFQTNELSELKSKPILEKPVIPDPAISPDGKWR